MAVPYITALPPAPQRVDSPADFTSKADAMVAALAEFVDDTNTIGDYVEGRAVDSDDSATLASGYAANSAASAAQSANSATLSASSANFKGAWSSLTGAASIPFSVYHDNEFWQLINNLADITTSEPGVTGDWVRIEMDKTADYTQTGAITVNSVWMADPSGGTVTRLTPVSPVEGQEFTVKDDTESATNTNKIIVDYDGVNTIMGLAEDLEITTSKQFATFKFKAADNDWRLIG